MDHKKNYTPGIYILIALAALALVVLLVTTMKNAGIPQNYTPTEPQNTIENQKNSENDLEETKIDEEENTPTPATPLYVVRIEDGRLAVFTTNSPFPFMMTDIYADQLPPADQEMFQKGMSLYSEAELTQFLEDFEG